MQKKNQRLAFRLRDEDMEKFEGLQVHFGESQAGTFRCLLTVKTDQEKLFRQVEKSTREISELRKQVDELASWLKQRVE